MEPETQSGWSETEPIAQKRLINRDLTNLLLGTIDTLVRGISPSDGSLIMEEGEVVKMETETDKGAAEESQTVPGSSVTETE